MRALERTPRCVAFPILCVAALVALPVLFLVAPLLAGWFRERDRERARQEAKKYIA